MTSFNDGSVMNARAPSTLENEFTSRSSRSLDAAVQRGLGVLAEVRTRVHAQEKVWMRSVPDADLRKLIKLLH